MGWQRRRFSGKRGKETCTKQHAWLWEMNNKGKKGTDHNPEHSCAAMISSLCLSHQTLPLKSFKYGDCTILLSVTPTTVLQGSGKKQIDSDAARLADHSSLINTTTLTANPGQDAAALPPPHRPQVPSNIRWEASSYSSRGSICNKSHPLSRPAAERLGTSHSPPGH